MKARGLKDPAGAKRRMEEKARAAKELESGGVAGGGGGGMKVSHTYHCFHVLRNE